MIKSLGLFLNNYSIIKIYWYKYNYKKRQI